MIQEEIDSICPGTIIVEKIKWSITGEIWYIVTKVGYQPYTSPIGTIEQQRTLEVTEILNDTELAPYKNIACLLLIDHRWSVWHDPSQQAHAWNSTD